MKKKLNIKSATDLNEIIASYNRLDETIHLDEKTLMFDTEIYKNLPYPLNDLDKIITKPSKLDLVLLGLLTILSGILKGYKVKYHGKEEGCQIYAFALANPGQGKGIASVIKRAGATYHNLFLEKYKSEMVQYKKDLVAFKNNIGGVDEAIKPVKSFLFCPGNNTKAALGHSLVENKGYALIYETEADTLFSANVSDFGGFGDILRMGFHGEAYSQNRRYLEDGALEIDSLNISILLTATLNQCFRLIPTSEDGLFSRFIYYFLPTDNRFENPFQNKEINGLDEKIYIIEKLFSQMGDINNSTENIMFSFSKEQAEEHTAIFRKLGDDIKIEGLSGNKMRFGLIFTRVSMLLSFIRKWTETNGNVGSTIQCTKVDFEITRSIMEKLFHHTIILNDFYETQNYKQKKLVFISKTIGDEKNVGKYSNEVQQEAINWVKKGLSLADAAEKFLGSKSRKPTIFRWVAKSKTSTFPVSQKGNAHREMVNVTQMLKGTNVSIFENVYKPKPMNNEGLDLFSLITTDGCKDEIEKIRKTINSDRRKILKNKLYAFTPSGLFKGGINRTKDTLQKHSGFICIDIDEKGNEGISNFNELTSQFAKISNVAFCGHSVSGKGYYLLIPIDTNNNHEVYFEGLVKAFKELGIEIDKSCKDVSRLRIMSYDETYYLADNAEVVMEFINSPKAIPSLVKFNRPSKGVSLTQVLNIIEKDKVDITGEYTDWVNIGYALVNVFGEDGELDFHSISKHYPKYDFKECLDQYKECLKSKDKLGSKCKTGTIIRIAREQGII